MNALPVNLVEVRGLEVVFRPPGDEVHAVRDTNFTIEPGEILGIVGESGSGKSVSMRAILGLTPRSARVDGEVIVDGMSGAPADMAETVRAMSAMVYQNPGAALNPVFTIGFQLSLVAGTKDPTALAALLDQVGLPNSEAALDSYPHEFSGGMQQRAVIALALAQNPRLLIADEPTTALDVTTEAQILDLLLHLREERQLSVAFISHDLGVIGRIADRVIVLKGGEVVESGTAEQVLTKPTDPYTQMLVASMPGRSANPPAPDTGPAESMLTISGLSVDYRQKGRREPIRVITDLDLSVKRGETMALVGESGSGKSTLANTVAGLVPAATGSITFQDTELVGLTSGRRRDIQQNLQMVFQNPLLSLSPRRSIRWLLHEPLRVHTSLNRIERETRIADTTGRLELDPELLDRRPHELSGGQAQRVVLARALLLGPQLIVFDEATSALDVSVQASVLDLLTDLKEEFDLTYLFITHDLAVARRLADRIAVMRNGELVEVQTTDTLFAHPEHPYTAQLLASSAALAASSGDLS